jgi:hypothetical protein
MAMNGDGEGEGYFLLNCMTRAEFKTPFSLSFQVTIEHNEGQCGNHFMFSFVDPDPNRGFLLISKLYGEVATALWAFDEYDGTDYCWVLNGWCGTIVSGENAWEIDHLYNVSFTPDPDDSRYTVLTIRDNETNDIKFQTNQRMANLDCKYLRAMFSVYEWAETFTEFTQFYVDNFNVVRATSKKAKAIVSISHSVLEGGGDVGNIQENDNDLAAISFYGQRFTQLENGSFVSINFWSTGGQDVRVALYSSAGNVPGSPLTDVYEIEGTAAGWNQVGIGGVELEEGVDYWIVFDMSAGGGVCYSGDGGHRAYIEDGWHYGDPFPDPWAGGDYDTGYQAEVYWIYEIEAHNEIFIASDDVSDINVSLRDSCYPSSSVTLDNKHGQYDDARIMDEIEIRAGWDHILWLLFRGYIDIPEFSFPPATVEISSSKGYASALEFRETDEESWVDADSITIVRDLIGNYYDDTQFTPDWLDVGTEISLDSDDEPVSEVLQKVAEMNGFIVYVDFNKAVNFVDPDNDTTQSNLSVSKAEDVVSIKNRLVDSIVNRVTVKGAIDTVTVEDEDSQDAYWRRDRTFTDANLTSLTAVTARANELLAKMKDPYREVPIVLPEFYLLELNDVLTVYCDAVGFSDPDEGEQITVKGATYNYNSSGLRTQISGLNRGFVVSDVLSDHDKKLKGIT